MKEPFVTKKAFVSYKTSLIALILIMAWTTWELIIQNLQKKKKVVVKKKINKKLNWI